jgi:hypothetical protein
VFLDPHDAGFLATYRELFALGAEIATLRSGSEERRALAGLESGAFQQATAGIRDDSAVAGVLVELEILDLTVAPVSEETLWYARVLWTFEYKQCRRGRLDDRMPSADAIDIW